MNIIYQDDDILIVNKPTDILTIPDRFDTSKPNLYSQLNALYGKVFVVHRLDRETSGIIIFAKNENAHKNLSLQFENHETKKIYRALLDGVMLENEGVIDKPLAPHPIIKGKMTIAKGGKSSVTEYKVIERFKHFTLVEADIKTGRTHQIRVHFQSQGYPLAIDVLYGRRNQIFANEIKNKFKFSKFGEERPLMSRTTLHAWRLTFKHPVSQEILTFEADLPKDFNALLNQLRKWTK
jgi:23S rRNA pseudouridine955/2504/2580 synthase/23S rRNA pseudouridine1911/1915/1917 synthase